MASAAPSCSSSSRDWSLIRRGRWINYQGTKVLIPSSSSPCCYPSLSLPYYCYNHHHHPPLLVFGKGGPINPSLHHQPRRRTRAKGGGEGGGEGAPVVTVEEEKEDMMAAKDLVTIAACAVGLLNGLAVVLFNTARDDDDTGARRVRGLLVDATSLLAIAASVELDPPPRISTVLVETIALAMTGLVVTTSKMIVLAVIRHVEMTPEAKALAVTGLAETTSELDTNAR